MLTTEQRAEHVAIEQLQDHAEPIADFVARLSPRMAPIPEHQMRVLELFERSRHEEVFATIAMPPRHGKTTAVAHGLAYRTLYDPACLNFYATFGYGLSNKTSRDVRRLVRAASVPLSPEAQSIQHWETTFGGGLKATSIGGDVTGRGCNSGVIVLDDLIKGRKAANSPTVRDDAWDWLKDDIMSRLEPGSSLFVNMTHWHEDDVIGRLHIDSLGLPWEHIELAAVIDGDGNATDERLNLHAHALWPAGGWDLARLARIRLRGEHGWWSLFQQKPFPKGGGMFKRKWFVIVDDAPRGGQWVRRWDLAASTEADSAFTAGALVGLVDGRLFVRDVRRGQWSSYERDQQIVQAAKEDGRGVEVWLPQDPGQAGKSQKPHFAKLLHGFSVHFDRESDEKTSRAEPYASQAEAGNVHLVRAPWNRAFLDEHESFPAGKLKDQIDMMSGAYLALIRKLPRDNVEIDSVMGGEIA